MNEKKNKDAFTPAISDEWFVKAFAISDKVFKIVGWALTVVAIQVVARKTDTLWLGLFGVLLQILWMAVLQAAVYPIVGWITKRLFAQNNFATAVDFVVSSALSITVGIFVIRVIPLLVEAAFK